MMDNYRFFWILSYSVNIWLDLCVKSVNVKVDLCLAVTNGNFITLDIGDLKGVVHPEFFFS